MTYDEAAARVAHIREIAGDDEVAHSEEDALYHDFVRAIAQTVTDAGVPTAAALTAAAILYTEEIDFARWCA